MLNIFIYKFPLRELSFIFFLVSFLYKTKMISLAQGN